ncbi:hypothetical protein ONZ45_g4007 [Pleurotus djamor]|nr:hypothetical protein ONZ45_g4007 [Pleurotus djamor]
MYPRPFFLLVILAAALSLAAPANDWSKPCFEGECAYENPHPQVSSVFKLRGHPKALTDITPAAGWVILDCDPNTLEQEIRLVCQSHDDTGCDHVFSYHGPEDKLVRLPESCGHGPFARIASAKVAEDQTIPGHVDHKISRRDGVPPVVHILSIDTNFAAVDMSKVGQVEMAFQGINIPDVDANFNFADFDPFGWLGQRFNELGNTISNSAKDVAKAVTTTVNKIGEGVSNAWKTVKGVVENLPKTLQDATTFNVNTELVPDKTIELHGNNSHIIDIQHEPSCNAAFGGGLSVVMTGDALAQLTVGFTMKVFPLPAVDEFHFAFDINAEIDTKLNISAHIHGNFQSKRLTVFELGIPIFSVPGVFEVGPWIQLDTQAKAHLDVALEANLDLHYHIQHMRVFWPERKDETSQQEIGTKDSKNPLSLKLDASIAANAVIEGHIIPSVRLGVKLGKSEASAFVEADAYARVTLGAEAKIQAQVKRDLEALESSYSPPYVRRDLVPRSMDHGVSASFTGCIWLSAGVSIAAGVHGEIGNLKAVARAIIWQSDELAILQHCWHAGKDSRSTISKVPFEFKGPEGEHAPKCLTKAPALSSVGSRNADQLKPHTKKITGKPHKAK